MDEENLPGEGSNHFGGSWQQILCKLFHVQIVQVFHGGLAGFHGEEYRDTVLKVWAAHWSPWPSTTGASLYKELRKSLL